MTQPTKISKAQYEWKVVKFFSPRIDDCESSLTDCLLVGDSEGWEWVCTNGPILATYQNVVQFVMFVTWRRLLG